VNKPNPLFPTPPGEQEKEGPIVSKMGKEIFKDQQHRERIVFEHFPVDVLPGRTGPSSGNMLVPPGRN